MSRSVGIKRDLRLSKTNSYSNYNNFLVKSFCGSNGDSYDRFLIRMLEMGESLRLSNLVISNLLGTKLVDSLVYINLITNSFLYKKKINPYSSMEDLIAHFIDWHTGYTINTDVTVSYIESPKGEFGVILASDNTNKPLRCKIRSPSYFNLQSLPKLARGHYLADLSAIIGTIDIVFGEVDR